MIQFTLGMQAMPTETSSILSGIDGVSIKLKPPEMAFDCGMDVARYMEFVVTISAAAAPAVPHVAKWLFERFSKKANEKVVINGNTISGNNITVNQIINIVEHDTKDK